jgi:hypothetical protein
LLEPQRGFLIKENIVQSGAINRRVAAVPGNLRFAYTPSEDATSPTLSEHDLQSPNWVIEPPATLVAAKDFHFAVSASFRLNESMGNEFLFEEVR